ncbi:MAG: T9SS type A sorting domain-containing protein, partial [Flavobacteriales bacterium]|nr:T9SS type A sorting domain-containing protein [Flavobacteriales bacterium]
STTLSITDLSGRQFLFMHLDQAKSGVNQVTVDLSSLSNGVYLYTINAGSMKATRKLIVEK